MLRANSLLVGFAGLVLTLSGARAEPATATAVVTNAASGFDQPAPALK